MPPENLLVRECSTAELDLGDLAALRDLMSAAWPGDGFSDDDFAHGMGGRHWIAEVDGDIVSHASVVERPIQVDGRPLRTGYLEAVATLPRFENQGIGSLVVAGATEYVRAAFDFGALSTGRPAFYERLGWERWRGSTFVRTAAGLERTEEDDDGILVLRTPTTPPIDLAAPISCDWRSGDVW
jgi:aminoglycoside 2'-N-acetyltransferase I